MGLISHNDYCALNMNEKIKFSPISGNKYCHRCEVESEHLAVQIITSSRSQCFSALCSSCQQYQSQWIPKGTIKKHLPDGYTLDDIPIARFNCGERCAKCGKRGTEHHHWAPQGLFEDANDWPMDYLCKECHDAWHEKIDIRKIKKLV